MCCFRLTYLLWIIGNWHILLYIAGICIGECVLYYFVHIYYTLLCRDNVFFFLILKVHKDEHLANSG